MLGKADSFLLWPSGLGAVVGEVTVAPESVDLRPLLGLTTGKNMFFGSDVGVVTGTSFSTLAVSMLSLLGEVGDGNKEGFVAVAGVFSLSVVGSGAGTLAVLLTAGVSGARLATDDRSDGASSTKKVMPPLAGRVELCIPRDEVLWGHWPSSESRRRGKVGRCSTGRRPCMDCR